MSTLTVDDLKSIMIRCIGDDEPVDLGTDFLDTPLADLGYDSLALLETAAIVKREHGVVLTDDLVKLDTPRALLDEINTAQAAA